MNPPKANQVIDVVSRKDFTIKWSYKNNYAWWAEDLYVNKEGTKIIYIAKPTELHLYNPKPEKQPIVVIINEDQTKIVYRLEDIGGVGALKEYIDKGIMRTASSPTHIWCKHIMGLLQV